MPTALDSAEHNMITAARPVTSSSTSAGDPTPYDVLLAGIAASAHARETLTYCREDVHHRSNARIKSYATF